MTTAFALRARRLDAASLYVIAVAAAAAASVLPLVARVGHDARAWPAFLVLAAGAATAQAFAVRRPPEHAYQTASVFLVAAAVVLPASLAALAALVHALPEWATSRGSRRVPLFNVCNTVLDVLAAWAVFHLVAPAGFAVAAGLACLVFVALNHALLASVVRLSSGLSYGAIGLFRIESVATDAALAALGAALGGLWLTDVALIPFVLAPLALVHRSLRVPELQAEASVDPKTGLYNARHFARALREELGRARRFRRPLSVIMADLDRFRDVNGAHGHLGGDAVLRGVADVFREELREYDVPARFGGEEFCVLLPETPAAEALRIAERIRRAVAEREFRVASSREPVRATVSLGVAGFPEDAGSSEALVHRADVAVYRAKLRGRNRVAAAEAS
jgi:diguanylate cyclase (GGDEF)-like protein